MTETESSVLRMLQPTAGSEPRPFTLQALGGRRGSGLAVKVTRMVDKGWVRRDRRGGKVRTTYVYRITAAGAQALANHQLSQRIGAAQ